MGDGREARKRGSEEARKRGSEEARTGWPKDAPRLRQGGAAGREPETGENTRGSLGSPSNRSCFVLLVLTGLLFLLAARPHGDSHSPKRGLRNKRIVLDADIASPLRASTGTGAACWQFCCSLSGRGSPPSGNSSPKRSVCYASTLLFLLCWSRYVLFLLCWFSFVVFVVPVLKQ